VKSVDLIIAIGTNKERVSRGPCAGCGVAKVAGGDIERAWLDDAERRSRLGAAQARRHMAMLLSASGALARALTDWQPALVALAAELVPGHVDHLAVDLKLETRSATRVVAVHVDTEQERFAADTTSWPEGASSAIDAAIEHDMVYFSAPARPDRDGTRWTQPEPALAAMAKRLQLHSWMMAPIRARGEAIGVLTVGTTEPRRGLRPSDVAAYELAARCGLAIERVQLYRPGRRRGLR
jgi:GAF domain-containing protein